MKLTDMRRSTICYAAFLVGFYFRDPMQWIALGGAYFFIVLPIVERRYMDRGKR